MAHFARLDENNIVIQVIVVDNNRCLNSDGEEEESIGIAFCQELFGSDTIWKQTSYNHRIRNHYASGGWMYNPTLDAFVPPKPYESWVLDSETMSWVSPLGSAPELTDADGSSSYYIWNEDAYQADNTTGWVLEVPLRFKPQ